MDTVFGYNQMNAMESTPEMSVEKIIYVGCYTETPYAPDPAKYGIYVVRLHNERLEIVGQREEKNITFILVDKERNKLYATTEAKAPLSGIHRYDILSEESGALCNHIEVDFQHAGACYIGGLRTHKGALLAVAFYESGVVRLVVDTDNELKPQEAVVFKENSNVIRDRQEAPHPHAAFPLDSGDEFLVPDLGGDVLYKLRIHNHTARLIHEIKLAPGSGPRHVVKHPTYNLLFIVSELSNVLTVYEVDGLCANFIQTDEQSTLGDIENSYRVPEDNMQIAAHLQLSKDGQFVLVSNRGRHNSISIFKITNPDEGKIKLVRTISTQGYFPRFFTLIEDKYLLVANQLSNTLLLFRFDDGNVSEPISTLTIPNPAALALL
ncbi:Lactonase family protein [Aphelenchoides bicaudatus]|nr:Lactonase family protein [Aphelenchoides bicaudatus]